MADIAERLMQSGEHRLVLAGGETLGVVVDRLGIPGFASVRKSLQACGFCAPSVQTTARCCLHRNQAISAFRNFFRCARTDALIASPVHLLVTAVGYRSFTVGQINTT